MNTVPMLSQKELHLLLDYSPITGKLIWRRRSENCMFKDDLKKVRIFNSRYAGKIVGNIDPYNINITLVIKQQKYMASRVIWCWMTGEDPGDKVVRTKDRNDLNLAWDNLELITLETKMRKKKMCKSNKSGFTGIKWYPQFKKWHVTINKIFLGYFKDIDKAIAARKLGEKLIWHVE